MLPRRSIAILCALLILLPSASHALTPEPLYNSSSCALAVQQYLHAMRGTVMQSKKRAVAHAQIDFFEATKCLAHPPSTDAEKALSATEYAQLCKDRVAETTMRLQQAEDSLSMYQGELDDMAPVLISTCQNSIRATSDSTFGEPLRVVQFFVQVTRGVANFLVDAYTPAALELHAAMEKRAIQLQSIIQNQEWRKQQDARNHNKNKNNVGHKVLRPTTQQQGTTLTHICNLVVDILKEITPAIVQEYVAIFALLLAWPLIAAVMIVMLPVVLSYLVVVEFFGFFVKTVFVNGILRPLFLTAAAVMQQQQHAQGSASAQFSEMLQRAFKELFVAENAVTVATVAVVVGVLFLFCVVACLPPMLMLLNFFQFPVVKVYEEEVSDSAQTADSVTREKETEEAKAVRRSVKKHQ